MTCSSPRRPLFLHALSHKSTEVITEITSFYKEKEGSIKPPDIYPGANIDKIQMLDGREVWGSSSRDYVKNVITTIEQLFEEDGEGFTFRNIFKNLFPTGYKPELDVTEELGPEMISRYLQLIGIFRWAVGIGRINIFLGVSLLSQYQVSQRIANLELLYNVFAYLNKHPDYCTMCANITSGRTVLLNCGMWLLMKNIKSNAILTKAIRPLSISSRI